MHIRVVTKMDFGNCEGFEIEIGNFWLKKSEFGSRKK